MKRESNQLHRFATFRTKHVNSVVFDYLWIYKSQRGRGNICESRGRDFFFYYLEKEGWILKFFGEKQSLGTNDWCIHQDLGGWTWGGSDAVSFLLNKSLQWWASQGHDQDPGIWCALPVLGNRPCPVSLYQCLVHRAHKELNHGSVSPGLRTPGGQGRGPNTPGRLVLIVAPSSYSAGWSWKLIAHKLKRGKVP